MTLTDVARRPVAARVREPKTPGYPYTLEIRVPDEAAGVLTMLRVGEATTVSLDLRHRDHLESVWRALLPLFGSSAQQATDAPPADAADPGLPGSPAGISSREDREDAHFRCEIGGAR